MSIRSLSSSVSSVNRSHSHEADEEFSSSSRPVSSPKSVTETAREVLARMPQLDVTGEKVIVENEVYSFLSALGSPVVAKLHDVTKAERMKQEFEALCACESAPHCVQIRNPKIAKYRDRFAIPMNSAGKCDLFEYCKLLRVDNLKIIGEQVLEFLAYLNEELNLVHADLKPENIGMNGRLNCTVIDLGTAINEGDQHSDLGSFGHVHPEMLLECSARHCHDLFSLAATLYRVYTGYSFNPSYSDESDLEKVLKGFSDSLDAENLVSYNKMNDNEQKTLAKIYLSMYDYQKVFGEEFLDVINLIAEQVKESNNFQIIFQYNEQSESYELRDLGLDLPRFDWKEDIREVGVEKEEDEEDIESLISAIEELIMTTFKRTSAADLLEEPFFSQSIRFRLEIDESYYKKDYELVIINPEDRFNKLQIDLNQNQENVQSDCYHLLNGGPYHIEIRDKNNHEVVFKIDDCRVFDRMLLELNSETNEIDRKNRRGIIS